jgi:hypothetical protein
MPANYGTGAYGETRYGEGGVVHSIAGTIDLATVLSTTATRIRQSAASQAVSVALSAVARRGRNAVASFSVPSVLAGAVRRARNATATIPVQTTFALVPSDWYHHEPISGTFVIQPSFSAGMARTTAIYGDLAADLGFPNVNMYGGPYWIDDTPIAAPWNDTVPLPDQWVGAAAPLQPWSSSTESTGTWQNSPVPADPWG